MTIHFQRTAKGAAYPASTEDGQIKARYYLGAQKYVAVFTPSSAGPEVDLQPVANDVGVAVQYLYLPVDPHAAWQLVVPRPVERYAFVITTEAGAELVTRGGRLVVSEDPGVLAPPCVAVKFSGDPAWTVPVTDDPVSKRVSADESSASDRTAPDNPKESP